VDGSVDRRCSRGTDRGLGDEPSAIEGLRKPTRCQPTTKSTIRPNTTATGVNCSPPAQRTAVKLRPHQETTTCPVATSEPVVITTGDREDGTGKEEVRPSAFNGLLGGAHGEVVAENYRVALTGWQP
jgi:hypothetical protein